MRRLVAVLLAAVLLMAPLGAKAADLVVWWEKGYYAQEDEAVREIVAAFEQGSAKQVDLTFYEESELPAKLVAALKANQPPDFAFGVELSFYILEWAYEDQLGNLAVPLNPVLDLLDADAIEASMLLNHKTGKRALYALPMALATNHLHVWNNLLERAGFTLADVPKEWEAFWSFWCDKVQPAVRQALGRDDIWGIGLPMSAAGDTQDEVVQFQLAYDASWIGRDRRLRVDDPAVRAGMVKALDAYTTIWRKGCTPPDSMSWANIDNNKAFLAQTVVLTVNPSLSIPSALRTASPDDYYKNAVTIEWPANAHGQSLIIDGLVHRGVVFKAGGNPVLAGDFVRFLAEEGWLAHWLTFAGDRYLPPMRKLVEQPFWLDTSDPHRLRSAIQILTRTHLPLYMGVQDHEQQSAKIWQVVWGDAVNRVAPDGISPEQAVDEAIARIKQILSE
jgi:multiple sugar transport system substrate-binding protein